MWGNPPCVRCEEAPGVDEHGLCGHCHWVVAAEIQELHKTVDRLLAFDAFMHGREHNEHNDNDTEEV